MVRLTICALLAAVCPAAAQQTSSAVLDAMKTELARSQLTLKSQPVPPYYIGYEITETHNVTIRGEFGRLESNTDNRRRQLDVDLRLGDYALDNTRQVRGDFNFPRFGSAAVPIDNDPDAIRAVLWHFTDQRYKQALEQFTKVRTNVQVKVAQEDSSADFSREEPQQYSEPAVDIHLNRALWEDKVRKYTAPFAKYTNIYEATSFLQSEVETRWFVNTEGTVIQTSQPGFHLFVMATTKASDGMELPLYESYFAFAEKDLPDDATVLKAVDKMIHDLEALRVATVADAYTGPAILSGRASGVFFHEIFGHRVEGQRQKTAEDAQTFKGKIGEQVLSKNFSVYFDPTLRHLANTDLDGYYAYDNQGVKARRVTVVENGILKTFLMSRTPVQGIA
jgi:hypothetical protein